MLQRAAGQSEAALRENSGYPDSAGLLLGVYAQLLGSDAAPRLKMARRLSGWGTGCCHGGRFWHRILCVVAFVDGCSKRSSRMCGGGPGPRESLDLMLHLDGPQRPFGLLEDSLGSQA